jgi:diguanylate cyclase (GGDEF)-like protein
MTLAAARQAVETALPRTELVEAHAMRALLDVGPGGTEWDILAAATRVIVALLGERGSCVLLQPDRVVLATHAPELRDWLVDLKRYPEIEAALDQRGVITVEDVRQDTTLDAVRQMLPPSLRSIAVVPLLFGQTALGVLIARSAAVHRMSTRAKATAALVGELAGQLLVAARARQTPVLYPSSLSDAKRPAHRILLVDDDAAHTELVSAVLAGEGYLVECAGDGATALIAAHRSPPDLILLDVDMPVLDGFATAERLREDAATSQVPILFLTACDDLMARVRGFKLGAADFVQKPCFVPELLARVQRSLDHSDLRERLVGEAKVDPLTGLGNLRAFHERMALERCRWERYGTPAAMVVLDVDKLKRINDEKGHASGSDALAAIGRVLREAIRGSDLAVRYGGDEFVVLLAHASGESARRFAERTLVRVRALELGGAITVSIGVSCLDAQDAKAFDTLFERADAAAYRAKRSGGDRACSYEAAIDARLTDG